MSIYKIAFSPTGGTQKVVDRLAKTFAGDVQEIDLTSSTTDYAGYSFHADDICFVAVPSFGGRVPAPAVSRLASMTAHGAKAVLAVAYGNRAYEDTLLELHGILVKAGFRCVAAAAAVAEHSIMHQFASGRPNQEDLDELDQFAGQIKTAIGKDVFLDAARLPGSTPYREYHVIPLHPKAGKGCTSCGLCAEKCPVGAIPTGNPSQTDNDLCISCMRCVQLCPAQARTVNKLLLAGAVQKLKKACMEPKKNELFL